MHAINIHTAKAHFSELVQKALLGEEVIISKGNKPIVKLVSLDFPSKRRLGTAKGLVTYIAKDFDAPLDDFADDSP